MLWVCFKKKMNIQIRNVGKNDTFKHETKPPYWVSYWVIHSNDSFKWLIHLRMRQFFMKGSLNLWLKRFVQKAESFSNENKAECCCEMCDGSAVIFVWNYFRCWNRTKKSILCLKCKLFNFNYLFIQLLNEINVTFSIMMVEESTLLGHVMLLNCIVCYKNSTFWIFTAVR